MADRLSTSEAARWLQTSQVTVRRLLREGTLVGEQKPRGTRFSWEVDALSVERFLKKHGPFEGARRRTRPDVERLEREVRSLRSLFEGTPSNSARLAHLQAERDEIRARNVALTEALARTRTVADLQAKADATRSAVIEHLLAAMSATERADELRRAAVAELHEATAAFSRAGHIGALPERDPG